jgi:hypothetical protein
MAHHQLSDVAGGDEQERQHARCIAPIVCEVERNGGRGERDRFEFRQLILILDMGGGPVFSGQPTLR